MESKGTILLVDDELQLRKLLYRLITLEGFEVIEAGDLHAAQVALKKNNIDVLLCDVRLPDGNGVDFVATVKKNHPQLAVILLTAFGNVSDGVQAIKNGALDYLQKGDENGRIIPLLFQAVDIVRRGAAKAIQLQSPHAIRFSQVLGNSAAIKMAIAQGKKIAQSDAAVLLLGKTGTGKEVFAGAIHFEGNRGNKPFIAINCSAFSRDLLEGELFGHKAGAYTGAVKDKKGLVEVADTGTLFLDEVGEMPLDLQAKLLRFLESGEFIKVGDIKTSRVDIRVIAATNRNLQEEVKRGHFREDLFYRLNVFTIELPSLHERSADIPLLAQHFLDQYKPGITIVPDTLALLQQYPWPGNIRELRNVVHRASILIEGKQLLPEHLPIDVQSALSPTRDSLRLADVERSHIVKVLSVVNGNKTRAAQLLGIGIATLYRKLDEYQL